MKKSYLVTLAIFIIGCRNEDVFSPGLKYVYSPEWKVWEITLVDAAQSGRNLITRTRDIDTRYIFTDSVVYQSYDRGKNFTKFPLIHISLDSISFLRTDVEPPQRDSYFIRNMYTMNDAYPPADNLRKERDKLFPEIIGKFLFLQLENKQKIKVENKQLTEYLLLYN